MARSPLSMRSARRSCPPANDTVAAQTAMRSATQRDSSPTRITAAAPPACIPGSISYVPSRFEYSHGNDSGSCQTLYIVWRTRSGERMRVNRLLWMAALVAASPLAAQNVAPSDWPIPEGSRVRIRSVMLGDWGQFRGAASVTGSVVSATPDTLTFRADGDSTTTAILPIRRISTLEIARGTHDKKYGAWIGGLTGFVAGA